jgi:ATP-dependent RNA helicase RhlE
MKFTELNLNEQLLEAISHMGFVTATPIQQFAIPKILENKDLIACAQTGTGKTAAFILPILNKLTGKEDCSINTLIIVPTRELAIQIDESFKTYGKYTNLKSLVIFGGVNQVPQVNELKMGIDVLIATPGRLLDLHKQGI